MPTSTHSLLGCPKHSLYPSLQDYPLLYVHPTSAEVLGLVGCRHSLQDECRILLLHGLLHLLGHDHELGEEESDLMAQQEQDLLQGLAWKVCPPVMHTRASCQHNLAVRVSTSVAHSVTGRCCSCEKRNYVHTRQLQMRLLCIDAIESDRV